MKDDPKYDKLKRYILTNFFRCFQRC